MAKKKNENIKAAPVLRADSGGEQPTPETPVITKSYCVRDDWKDKGVVNYVAFKSVDGEVQDLTVNGEPAGGGGGGDFSTAKVTVIMKGDGDYNGIRAPLIDGNQAVGFGESTGETTVFTVILYKGTAIAQIDIVGGENPLIISGNITQDGQVFTITGDGSITIS